MPNFMQVGTIIYKDQNFKVIQTKQIYIQQELIKQDLFQNFKNLFDITDLENLKKELNKNDR